MIILTTIKKYLVALLGALASALAVLYFRKEALFQKAKRQKAEEAAQANEQAIDNMREQSTTASDQQAKQQQDRKDAVSRDSFLDYFE